MLLPLTSSPFTWKVLGSKISPDIGKWLFFSALGTLFWYSVAAVCIVYVTPGCSAPVHTWPQGYQRKGADQDSKSCAVYVGVEYMIGHPRWLFSRSLYNPGWTSAFFTYTLLTWLTFLCTCTRSQLMIGVTLVTRIAYQKGSKSTRLLVFLVTSELTWCHFLLVTTPCPWKQSLLPCIVPAACYTWWGFAPGPCFTHIRSSYMLNHWWLCCWLHAFFGLEDEQV